MVALPKSKKYVIIGAGMHGLSTAWDLAKELKARGKGSGDDIVVLDKTAPGAGASGIACGIVRNFYYQPAMGEVMRVSVDVWEENAEAFDRSIDSRIVRLRRKLDTDTIVTIRGAGYRFDPPGE